MRVALRFIVVGATTATLYFVLTYVLLFYNFRPALAILCAYSLAFIFAYVAHKSWSFSLKAPHAHILPKYFLAQILSLAFGVMIAELFFYALSMPHMWTAMAATIGSSLLSFYLSSRWVFSD